MEPVDYVVCTRVQIPRPTVRGYRIAGLCLDPEIRDGDTIIVDTELSPVDGDLVVVIGDKETHDRLVAVKRFSKNGGAISYLEDNDGRCELDDKGCCGGVCLYGVITEYNHKLRQM